MFLRKRSLVWLLAFCFLLIQLIAGSVFAQTTAETDRISGDDRYKTAVAVSQKGWNTSDYAVLARGDNFADALCAGPLAQKYGGPILLTQPNQLNSDTLTELQRLGVKHLFITGGLGAVSKSVEDALQASGIATIERINGDDRYETSVKIAEKIGHSGKVVLATGSDYPDALSISGIAAKLGMPILLTAKNTLPSSVGNYFHNNTVTQTYVVGGIGVISAQVADGVPGSSRLAGGDRYATNIAIMQNFAGELNFEAIYVATGSGFADALTGAVLAAKNSSALVLTNQLQLPKVTGDYLKTVLKEDVIVVGLGGENVVSSVVLEGIIALLQPDIETMNIAVYYLKASTNDMYLVREVHEVEKSVGVARAALSELISGTPLTSGAYRVLPPDTKILGITIENGIATVDFSAEVLNANVGASGEALGITSIVNTLTEFSTIQKVQFTVDGSVENGIDWWGHVGLSEQPFERNLSSVYEPIIWVNTPVANQTINSPLTIRGNALVFEATVSYRLKDTNGNILAQGFTMADSGAPDRGDFEAVLHFSPSSSGEGQLEVFEVSAKDGSDVNMVIIPVKW